MGFYSGWLFPRVLDLIMRQQQMIPFRERIGKAAAGRVLDVGIGSGLNLPFYGNQIDRVVGVDPSPELLRFAEKRARETSNLVALAWLRRGLADRGSQHRYGGGNLHFVHRRQRDHDACGNSAGAQAHRHSSLRRARPRARRTRCSVARQAYARMESHCGWLSPQSQAG